MNIEAGLIRLATVIEWIGIAWLVIVVGFAAIALFWVTDRIGMLLYMAGAAAAGFIPTQVIGWVIRGFAKPKNES